MGKKRSLSGLRLRNGVWHIEKMVDGKRLYESTRTSQPESRSGKSINLSVGTNPWLPYSVPDRHALLKKPLRDISWKTSINAASVMRPTKLNNYASYWHMMLDKINMFSLQPYITLRQQQGVKNRTINHALQMIRRIINSLMMNGLMNSG